MNTLFKGVVAAPALGFGLAFGLDGRDTASEIVRDWFASGRRNAPRLAQAADAAGQQAQATARGYQAAIKTDPAPPTARGRVASELARHRARR